RRPVSRLSRRRKRRHQAEAGGAGDLTPRAHVRGAQRDERSHIARALARGAYQKVCDAAVHGGKFITTAAILADPATGQVTVAASTGVGAALMRQFRISVDANVPEGRGTVGTAYRTGKPCVTNDYLNDERVRPWRKEGIALGV